VVEKSFLIGVEGEVECEMRDATLDGFAIKLPLVRAERSEVSWFANTTDTTVVMDAIGLSMSVDSAIATVNVTIFRIRMRGFRVSR
jgi:hypothetical protein